jgi:valyl-tRNA synthetase
LEKKRQVLVASKDKLQKGMGIEGYNEKVPIEVRNANSEKLQQTETELARLADAIQALKILL